MEAVTTLKFTITLGTPLTRPSPQTEAGTALRRVAATVAAVVVAVAVSQAFTTQGFFDSGKEAAE